MIILQRYGNIFITGNDADGKDEAKAERIEMKLQSPGNEMHVYHAEIITGRQPNDYTVRIIPRYENITVPLEDNHIIW
ncbi:MAG: hypothetical protein M3R50_04325, partial [Bacteroidota bacterium]|nr:hypothetical protein [Bacteroidota bacterium]